MLLWTLLVACPARRSWPDAAQEAQVEALSADVRIAIDALGVPHITAASLDDAAAATGWMHARDRGFQLELLRHAGQGRLTELFGEDLLQTDRRLRILTWQLDEQVAGLSAAETQRLERYCEGVNAGFAATPAPMEFRLLGHEPAPWTVRDVISVMRLQAWDTTSDASEEAIRDRTLQATDAATLAWLAPEADSWGASILEPDPSGWPALPEIPPPPVGASDASAAAPPTSSPAVVDGIDIDRLVSLSGSNAFAVSGDRTADGRPLMAGDPHLSLPWPSFFYEVSITTPQGSVHGASVPGLPAVIIGHAGSLVWSLTNSYIDVQDLYRLTVDGDRYLLDGEWQPLTPWPQTFVVGEETIEETFYASVHGPLFNPGREDDLVATYAISWIGFEPMTEAHTVFDDIFTVQAPDDLRDVLGRVNYPAQSWIWALESGEIGYGVNGLLPNAEASLLPRDGTTPRSPDIPRLDTDRPFVVNPPSGVVVSTNQPLFDDGRVNGRFSGAWRALRGHTVLAEGDDWTAEKLIGLQRDTVNLEAAVMLPVMLTDVGPAQLGPRTAEMVALLSEWDHRMVVDSPAPLIYEAWRAALHRYLIGLHLDEELTEVWLDSRLSEAPVTRAVLSGGPMWDDPATEGAQETRQTGSVVALEAAAELLSEAFGGKPSRWTWGEAHTLSMRHPFAAKAILRPWFGFDAVGLDGGRHVLLANGHEGVVGDFTVDGGAAMRIAATPGGHSTMVVAGGSAGQPRHPHATSQFEAWIRNDQHEMAPPDAAATTGRIVLSP